MASLTTRSSSKHTTTRSQSHQHRPSHHKSQQEVPNSQRKRQRDSIENEHDAILNKRARIDVRVEAVPKSQLNRWTEIVIDAPEKQKRRNVSDQQPDQPAKNFTSNHINGNIKTAKASTGSDAPRAPTVHSQKVTASIKHELDGLQDRLQPEGATSTDEKRKLRSQEGTRFKSELGLYFPDYDVVIGNDSEEIHLLNVDTPIVISDQKPQPTKGPSPGKIKIPKSASRLPAKSYQASLYEDLYNATRVDFTSLEHELEDEDEDDPLKPSYYDVAHKKAERVEKNIRNTEKGRAQHEKDQVIRLLEGLQGHDWLKIMGVSGITESRKKDYAPARDHFIRGCQYIVEKFRLWKEEEKRRKAEKDRLLAEAAEEEEDDDDDEEADSDEQDSDEQDDDDDDAGNESDGDPPDYSDIDHAAARQLHEEAMSRLGARSSSSSASSKRRSTTASIETPEKEFKSFFAKPHLREAALSGNRRSGRKSIAAFGQPIPILREHEFELPEELMDSDLLNSDARAKRRVRRGSKA